MKLLLRLKKWLESVLPMTLGNLVLLAAIGYLIFIVSKTVWENYQSNKELSGQAQKLTELDSELNYMENEIAYFKTKSFREKQARSKLAYVAAGETAISLPLDKISESENSNLNDFGNDISSVVSNYYLWLDYFFK